MPFYATVTGVGRKQDGFYISDTTGFAVYKPADVREHAHIFFGKMVGGRFFCFLLFQETLAAGYLDCLLIVMAPITLW